MEQTVNTRLFYWLSGLFVAINSVAIAMDFIWLNLVPYVFIFAMLVLFRLDIILLTLCFLVPLSVNIDDIGFGLGISLPDEPLIMGIMCLTIFKFIIHSQYDYKVFRHPISVIIIANVLWIFITSCTSELPLVSFKFFLSKLWYVVVFYFLGVMLFRKFGNITKYLWLYLIPLVLVVMFTLVKHSAYNFDLKNSFEISQPFYIAHGVYAAAIAFFIPIVIVFLVFPKTFGYGKWTWMILLFFLAVLTFGLIYSYTRASWISIAVGCLTIIPLAMRIRFNTILVMLVSGISFFFVFHSEIMYVMSKTSDESSKDFAEHLNSISNINTDASNAERINRWVCAWFMFEEKPIVGFGPGTYSFVYGPFQLSKFRTIISTDFGDGGNAHSEYLGPLCESGFMGFLTTVLMVYYSLSTAFRLFYTAHKRRVRITALAILLALVTYFVHGAMNNYSETDKIAILWWGAFAMLTALDVYHNRQPSKTRLSQA